MNRREFITHAALIGSAIGKVRSDLLHTLWKYVSRAAMVSTPVVLTNCATDMQALKQYDPSDFPWRTFAKAHKSSLYKPTNPNLKRPHGRGLGSTFRSSMDRGYTPGIDYKVGINEIMVACAPGRVFHTMKLKPRGNAALGNMVIIGHPHSDPMFRGPVLTYYAHLGKLYVDKYKLKVQRGDPIGVVPLKYRNFGKIMVQERGFWADPDKFGKNYGYLDYRDTPHEYDEQYLNDRDFINNRFKKVRKAVLEFDNHRVGKEKYGIGDLWHKEKGYGMCTYSWFEIFDFLKSAYELNNDLYPGLFQADVDNTTKVIYDNQPLELSLPLKKGGLKKSGL